jgi:outer membrane protein
MKNLTHSLLSAGVFFAASLFANAQAPKVATVDMEKIFNTHYATVAEQAKLKANGEKAQQELDAMIKERDDLVNKYKASLEQANNPLTTGDAKTKAQADTQKIGQDAQAKVQDIQKFANDARTAMQQQFQNFRSLLVDEISKTASRIAKDKGATILMDKSSVSAAGVPVLLYADSSYDITEAVQAEIAKNKPADMPAAPSATSSSPMPSSSSSSSSSSGTPSITVPGVTPSK